MMPPVMPLATGSSPQQLSTGFYKACRLACNFIKFQCISETVLHAERTDRSGPAILACTHISHLEPIVVSTIVRRNIRWMSRIEFYRSWWGAAMLNRGGAFPVDRFGFSLPAIRRGIELISQGQFVGIFPEGGVAKGANSLLRGGTFKQGVCTLALRTGVPIIPVVILGTEKLNRVGPWIPPRRARLFTAFGRDVLPPKGNHGNPEHNRALRRQLEASVRAEFIATYQELLAHTGLTDRDVP
jgi:1-acyl-sn-glycerol-3-phosphate acyltransferase